jgi:4-hydroxythreonine-4-phosphate dehydrogenase
MRAMPETRPTVPLPLALTMGDPCGIGPETVLRAARRGALDAPAGHPAVLVIGDPAVLQRAARALDGAGTREPGLAAGPVIAEVDGPGDLPGLPPGTLAVRRPRGLPADLADLPWGRVDARAGAAAAACVRDAIALARTGAVEGIVTAPLHKEALAAAGETYPGHTELLAAEARGDGVPVPVRMMLANEQLRTVLVTVHLALREAVDAVRRDAVLETLRIAHAAAALWGQSAPRIAVAGLNPHAGEGGLFGREEIEEIAPAIAAARAEGIDARGPFAPDTVFMRARHAPPAHPGEFDLVVAMTHDHGLIPVKYLGVDEGVNVTLGLPFVRTSPDHGTAFDIAGQGRADPASLLAALAMARRLVAGRRATGLSGG